MSESFLITFGVLLLAYFVRGVTGFGSGLIAVPLLAHFHSLKFVVPLVMSLDFIASFILGGVSREKTAWAEIGLLLPFGILGAMLGVYALVNLPAPPVLLALGLFAAFFGLRNVLGVQPKGEISRLWALPAGLTGSGAGALFGTSAPPYIIYLTHRLGDKTAVRSTFSWLFVIDGGFRLLLFAIAGLLLDPDLLMALGLGLVPMGAGLYMGNHVHVKLTREQMLRFVGIFLVASGLSLVLKVVL